MVGLVRFYWNVTLSKMYMFNFSTINNRACQAQTVPAFLLIRWEHKIYDSLEPNQE